MCKLDSKLPTTTHGKRPLMQLDPVVLLALVLVLVLALVLVLVLACHHHHLRCWFVKAALTVRLLLATCSLLVPMAAMTVCCHHPSQHLAKSSWVSTSAVLLCHRTIPRSGLSRSSINVAVHCFQQE